MEKIEYCYHTHTTRCGHAVGEDEEYVKAAIAYGIKRLGFTDHVMLPGYTQPGIRGDYSLKDDYIKSIKQLREKYKDQIEILVGFECEYMDEMVDYYKELLKEVDYLILGQHCRIVDGQLTWYSHGDKYEGAREYVRDVTKGIKSGLFTYFAHPDLIISHFGYGDPIIDELSHEILRTCQQYGMTIELNLGPMRRRHYDENEYSYPNARFFEISKQYNLNIVMGIDAHNPNDFNDDDVMKGFDFRDRHGLKINEHYFVKPYNKMKGK